MKHRYHKPHWLKHILQSSTEQRILFFCMFALVGALIIVSSKAATSTASLEAESGNTTMARVTQNDSASGKYAVKFGKNDVLEVLFRNSNPMYNMQANVPTAQLDLSKNLEVGHPNFDPTGGSGFGQRARLDDGEFRTWCTLSHFSKDDPVIFPNQPGAAHLHMFYGNTGTNAYSNGNTILNSGGSSCSGFEANRSSYWFPAMLDTNHKVRVPNLMDVYYKAETIDPPAGGYSAVPGGLKMLADNPKATTPFPVTFNDGWGCADMFQSPTDPIIPVREGSTGRKLFLKLTFPRCWDGQPIDMTSSAFVEHVHYSPTYRTFGPCTEPGYSKVLPEIETLMQWELAPNENTDGWFLTSDITNMSTMAHKPGGTTRHADYIAGWNPTVISAWHQSCINEHWNCQSDFISNKVNFPIPMNGQYNKLKETNFQLYDQKGPVILDIPH